MTCHDICLNVFSSCFRNLRFKRPLILGVVAFETSQAPPGVRGGRFLTDELPRGYLHRPRFLRLHPDNMRLRRRPNCNYGIRGAVPLHGQDTTSYCRCFRGTHHRYQSSRDAYKNHNETTITVDRERRLTCSDSLLRTKFLRCSAPVYFSLIIVRQLRVYRKLNHSFR